MKLISLYSGSSGNATLITNGKTNILIDMGKNAKQTALSLSAFGLLPKDISAIFLTHEHGDHIRGLKVFTKNHPTPIIGQKPTLDYLYQNQHCGSTTPLKEFHENEMDWQDFTLSKIPTNHDSLSSCGYTISCGKKKVAVLTDLGEITKDTIIQLADTQEILLESNYDENLLSIGSYPYSLKQRIRSKSGHLSNEACSEAIVELAKRGTKKFLLAHLSKENNLPILAVQTVKSHLQPTGYLESVRLQVAKPNSPCFFQED